MRKFAFTLKFYTCHFNIC